MYQVEAVGGWRLGTHTTRGINQVGPSIPARPRPAKDLIRWLPMPIADSRNAVPRMADAPMAVTRHLA